MAMNELKEKVSELVDKNIYDINILLDNYEKYILAYCAELKLTECDILNDEELFNNTFHLFEKVVLERTNHLVL